ncbi:MULTISPECIES: EF-hand domain-containing protein [unclassified Shinella]|uniref:EF-hand domain-containing protein n=1 Tax=unclassified Shinella TaxID=2643062 RepID=UPI00225D5065|nr:EF-hand domain-containing protein [Shinella sp. YE25]MDC7259439.1 EF-hand domain-containing protein [Shinella sp. YE25]CAI0341469.1 Signal transduction protein [Rhizobiaceae bacterium]CAK7261099.1 EF-hand domain-containing protein [Shinella sp. WSC3-e]
MKKASYALVSALVAALSLPGISAHAQTVSPILQRLDANNDGAVSRDEIVAARAKLFARLDVNSDGVIDQDETEMLRDAIMDRATAMQARLGNQMRRLDTSGDGKVSRDEFRARTLFFDLADRDGDGKLSAAEFLVIRGIMFDR